MFSLCSDTYVCVSTLFLMLLMRRTSDVLVLVYSHIQNIPEVSVTQNNILRIYCKHLSHLILLSDWLNTGLSHACRLWKHMRRITPQKHTKWNMCQCVHLQTVSVPRYTGRSVIQHHSTHTGSVFTHTHTKKKMACRRSKQWWPRDENHY